MTNSVNLDQLEERPVLVVDYGAQYAQLIARRVREAGIYSEIVPHSMSTEKMLAKNPAAIVLSGTLLGLRRWRTQGRQASSKLACRSSVSATASR